MNIKRILPLILLFSISTVVSAQQIFLETGKTSSSFIYKNSQGVAFENLQATNHTFMTMGYRTQVFVEKLKTSLSIGYFGYGATGSDHTLEGILDWNINYLEVSGGLDYSLYAIKKTEFYLKGMLSTGFFIQGTQSLNNEIINLKNTDDFNKTMISFKTGAGVLHPVSKELSFYVQYLFGKSVNQANDNESLKIKSHNVGFGVLIELFNK